MTVVELEQASPEERNRGGESSYADTMARITSSVPVEATSFVGRRLELHKVKQLLSKHRSLVLTGPAGVGKTRLAKQAATTIERAFDGVVYVALEGETSESGFERALHLALDFETSGAGSAVEWILGMPPTESLLLVLDGCEQIWQECAEFIDSVEANPSVSIIATSRRRLGTAGGVTWAVPPMTLSNDGGALSLTDATRIDSVALFVTRAQSVYPAFELTDRNLASVSELCARLDGLPLALELAAARMRALSVEQLVTRLDNRFRLLTLEPGNRRRPKLSLWDVLAESFANCSDDERGMWAASSVFAGSFSLDDIEAVCCATDDERIAAADVATGLIDQSVFGYVEQSGDLDYRLLDTLRKYGAEQLEADGATRSMRLRHLAWISDLARETEPFWTGPEGVRNSDKLLLRHSDILAALNFSMYEQRDPASALRLAADLRVHWMSANRVEEGLGWVTAALEAYDRDDELRAVGLSVAIYLSALDSQIERADQLLVSCRELAARLQEPLISAHCAFDEGLTRWAKGEGEAAAALLEDAYHRYRALGATSSQREALFILGMVLANDGDLAGSLDEVESNLAGMAEEAHWWGSGYVLWIRGYAALKRKDIDRSQKLLRQCITQMQPHNDRSIIWWCLELLGWVAAEQSSLQLAAQLLGAARTFGPHHLPPVLQEQHDRHIAAARRALGGAKADRLQYKGTLLTMPQAVELAITGGDGAPRRTHDTIGEEKLSEREIEVAKLIAQGHSNKAIAAALVIATRTAEGHVQKILAKRGFTSRSQIAAWISESASDEAEQRDTD